VGGCLECPTLGQDDNLSLLSSELKHLGIGIAALSEVRRTDCGKIVGGGDTYLWSGYFDGYHAPRSCCCCVQ